MNQEKYRNAFLYKEYFSDFYSKQKTKVKEKIIWTMKVVETLQSIPEECFKHVESTDGIYEIRVKQGSDIFRIFSFFDEGKLIVLANGFQKKHRKHPNKKF